MLLICQQNEILDVLMNFAALNIIIDVDDIYTNCVTNLPFREILQYDLPKWKVSSEEFDINIKTSCYAA